MTKVASFLRGLKLSIDEIALKARLSPERVRSMMQGGELNLAELRALAQGLKLPLRVFSEADGSGSDLALLFRSTSASRPDLGVETAASFVDAAISILPPRESPPEWLSTFGFQEETYEEASRLAAIFRQLFAYDRPDDPLDDLAKILVNQGNVILGRLETSRFEGASAVVDGYCFIFVSPRFSGRMLFTLAHELGHLISHHSNRRAVVFDLSSQIGRSRPARSKSEAFVDAFASVLLLPARGVGRALRQIRSTFNIRSNQIGDVEILVLARLYGVSFEVAARRCEHLELLPTGGAVSLSEYLRKNHGSAERRADSLRLPKRPPPISIPRVSSNLLRIAAAKVERGEISLGWVIDRFACTVSDVYGLRIDAEESCGYHH